MKDYIIKLSNTQCDGFAVFSNKREDGRCTSESEHTSIRQAILHCKTSEYPVVVQHTAAVHELHLMSLRIEDAYKSAKDNLNECDTDFRVDASKVLDHLADFIGGVKDLRHHNDKGEYTCPQV